MKKTIIISGILVLSGFLWWQTSGYKTIKEAGDKPVVTLGVMLPLSGDNALIGQAAKGAVEVALEDVNLGQNRYRYKAVFEDTQLNAAKSSAIVQKLLFADKVDALLTFGSNVAQAVSLRAEKSQTIHIAMASSAEVSKGKYNFINWTQPERQAAKMAEVIKDKGYRKVTLAATNNQGAVAVSEAVAEQLAQKGIGSRQILLNPGSKDMRMEILKEEQTGTELYVLMAFNPEAQIFIRQLRELQSKADVTSIETFNFYDDYTLVEGQWFIDIATENNETTERIKKYNKLEMTYGIGSFYDSVRLLEKAYEKAADKNKAVEELKKVSEYKGISGKLQQDRRGIFQSEAVMKKIINGRVALP